MSHHTFVTAHPCLSRPTVSPSGLLERLESACNGMSIGATAHPFIFLGISRLTNPHPSVPRLRKELYRNSIYIPLDRPGPERAVSQVPPGHIFGFIFDFGLAPSRGLFSACTNFLSTSVLNLFSTFDVAVWGLSHAWLF